MKKLINRPDRVVEEMLEGLAAMNPGLALLDEHLVILRADAQEMRNKAVALISGGGSGHEPAHAGFVGAGMLSAAVAGEVFTSPSSDAVFAGIKAVTGVPGALLIIKNYTGDRLNFGLAAEMARADGLNIESVVVADDIALAATHGPHTRRGIAGTIFVHKIAGAAAAEGKPLGAVKAIAQQVAQDVSSMGVSLSSGIIPAVGKPSFTLSEEEVELGLGIHGEPGVSRAPLESADSIVDRLIEPILNAQNAHSTNRIALLLNNLGATTAMEMAIVGRRAMQLLRRQGLKVERVYAGTFMSSLEMAGISISILPVDENRLRWLDAPTTAPAWPNVAKQPPRASIERTAVPVGPHTERSIAPARTLTDRKLRAAITAACVALQNKERELTQMDQAVGDGDLGISLARGTRAIQAALDTYPLDNPAGTLKQIGLTLQRHLGGSSGPLYGVLFLRAAKTLSTGDVSQPHTWATAATEACHAVSDLGGAKEGDRTMLDALIPFAKSFHAALGTGAQIPDALAQAAAASESAAAATAQLFPRRGRSAYLGQRALGHPDPGAMAVAIWLRAAASALSGSGSASTVSFT